MDGSTRQELNASKILGGIWFLAQLFVLPVVGQCATFQETCLAFAPENLILNSTRTIREYIPAGANLSFPDNDPSCSRKYQVVSTNLCRVALSIPTSNRSSITYEHWLPETWGGRLLAIGNGGIDGCIKYEDLAYGARNGFATSGTNNGHNGTAGNAFYRNYDVVVDYAWRALHTGAVASKALADNFYAQNHTKSYYIGCSGGGRQGIKAAEMFPNGEFDGIIAGAPAVDFNNLYSWRARFFTLTGPANSSNFIQTSTWKGLIHSEVLKQCDHIDGVEDGILTDPSLCNFNPDTLLCPNPNETTTNGTCLNEAQVSIVRAIFSPYKYPNGTLVYPAMEPGSEEMAIQKLYAGAPFSYSEDWFRYAIRSDPSWDPSTFSIQDAELAQTMNPANVRTWPSDLAAFRDSGGKIIVYHGGQDQQISAFNSERFYSHLSHGMTTTTSMHATSAGIATSPTGNLDSFYRFYRIEGMFHCSSGPGAWVLGQGGGAASEGIPFEPESNILAALVAWVENDTAPEVLRGTKFVGDEVDSGVDYVRDHCRYPLRNTYVGGDGKGATSWECRDVASSPVAMAK